VPQGGDRGLGTNAVGWRRGIKDEGLEVGKKSKHGKPKANRAVAADVQKRRGKKKLSAGMQKKVPAENKRDTGVKKKVQDAEVNRHPVSGIFAFVCR